VGTVQLPQPWGGWPALRLQWYAPDRTQLQKGSAAVSHCLSHGALINEAGQLGKTLLTRTYLALAAVQVPQPHGAVRVAGRQLPPARRRGELRHLRRRRPTLACRRHQGAHLRRSRGATVRAPGRHLGRIVKLAGARQAAFDQLSG